jgi:hypothetical protein
VPGGYALSIAAPGYVGLGGSIRVTRDPGPILFPDGGSVSLGKAFDILLAPRG